MSEPSRAAPKPATWKPSSTLAAAQNMSALITNRNSPTVTMVTGSVSTTSTGRSTTLNSPITKAAINAEGKLFTSTPL